VELSGSFGFFGDLGAFELAFVPGYKFDLFISYAHLDNVAVTDADPGWVHHFGQRLRASLQMRLGSKDFNMYFDNINLRGHHAIEGISDQARDAAVLVVVLSNSYLQSDFCMQKELKVFLERDAHARDRIYVVRKSPLDDPSLKQPAELYRLRGCDFWEEDQHKEPLTLGQDVEIDDRYRKALAKAANDICTVLRGVKEKDPGPTKGKHNGTRQTVLLAEVTEDLHYKREQVKTGLEQYGIAVLPGDVRYPRPGFPEAFDEDLKQCCALVQLLSAAPGRPDVSEAPRGYPWLQYERAQAAGLPIFQWRSPKLPVTSDDDEEHLSDEERALNGAQAELLKVATVQELALPVFIEDVRQKIETPSVPKAAIIPHSIYINHDPLDDQPAQHLQDRLHNEDWSVARTPLFEENPEKLRLARDRRMLEYEAVVFLYGAVNQEWIDGELSEFMKIQPSRSEPTRAQAVILAPPGVEKKPSPSVRPKGTKEIKAPNGIDDSVFAELKSHLKI
jgi:hypothetical protein